MAQALWSDTTPMTKNGPPSCQRSVVETLGSRPYPRRADLVVMCRMMSHIIASGLKDRKLPVNPLFKASHTSPFRRSGIHPVSWKTAGCCTYFRAPVMSSFPPPAGSAGVGRKRRMPPRSFRVSWVFQRADFAGVAKIRVFHPSLVGWAACGSGVLIEEAP